MTEDSIERIRERILEEQYEDYALNEVLADARAMTLAYDALVKKLRSHPPNIHVPAKVPAPREWIRWDQFNPKERLVLRQQDEESEMCVLTEELATSANRDTAQTEKELNAIQLTSEQMMWLWGAAGELLLGSDTVEVKLAKAILENDDHMDLIHQLREDLRAARDRVASHIGDVSLVVDALKEIAVESAFLILGHLIQRAETTRQRLDEASVRTTNQQP